MMRVNIGNCLVLEAESLHGPDVVPAYRYFIKAKGQEDYAPLKSTGSRYSLDGLEPGTYKVRVEASGASGASGSGCDAYAETAVTIKE